MLDNNDFALAESNVVLAYPARGTKFLPDTRKEWNSFQSMFLEQYSHEPLIATLRLWPQHRDDSPEREALLASKMAGGWAALRIIEDHLGQNEFYVGDYFIAEIALFAYMHVAREGDFPLDALPKVTRMD